MLKKQEAILKVNNVLSDLILLYLFYSYLVIIFVTFLKLM